MSLEPLQVVGYSIIFSEFNLPEDQHFDFNMMAFREPKK